MSHVNSQSLPSPHIAAQRQPHAPASLALCRLPALAGGVLGAAPAAPGGSHPRLPALAQPTGSLPLTSGWGPHDQAAHMLVCGSYPPALGHSGHMQRTHAVAACRRPCTMRVASSAHLLRRAAARLPLLVGLPLGVVPRLPSRFLAFLGGRHHRTAPKLLSARGGSMSPRRPHHPLFFLPRTCHRSQAEAMPSSQLWWAERQLSRKESRAAAQVWPDVALVACQGWVHVLKCRRMTVCRIMTEPCAAQG